MAGVTAEREPAGGEALPGRYVVFTIVSLALMMASVDQTIVATALPSLQHDLHAPVNWSTWTITIYALGQILVMPLAGKLGDQYGRKKIFLGAAVLFTMASLCCGFADSIYMLIVLRGLPGHRRRRVHAHRDRHRRPSSSAGTGTGPSACSPACSRWAGSSARYSAALLVTYWSWRVIFLVNVPLGIILISAGAVFIPASTWHRGQRLDVRGVVLLGATLLAAMFGVAILGDGKSPADPAFLVLECLAVVGVVLFARHTVRSAAPFISAEFLVGRGFGVMNLINFLFGASVLGFAALVPLYAEQRYGLPTLDAGTLLSARGVGAIAAAGLAVVLLRRTGYRWPMLVGFSLTALGLIGMAVSPHGLSPYAWLSLAAGLTGVGMGVSTPASNNATLQLAPDQSAAVAGLRGMFRQSGAITAVSLTAAVLARSGQPSVAQAHIFVVFALIMIAVLPLLLLVPEHRGRW